MLDSFLSQVQSAWNNQNAVLLASLLSTSSGNFQQLKQSLNATPHLRPQSYVSHVRSILGHSERALADLLAAWLLFCRDSTGKDTAEGLEKDYTLMEDVYRQADKLFPHSPDGLFVPTLRLLTSALISLALRAGRAAGDTNLTKAGEAARMLGRPMGIAASDRSSDASSTAGSKKSSLLFLATSTFRVYFAMHNLRLCDTILTNISNSVPSLDSSSGAGGGGYPKADRVAFHYYRGRLLLYQRRLPQARRELSRAFALCHREAHSQARLILIYLIPSSLPLGHFPSSTLLSHFGLQEQYSALIPALAKGNWVVIRQELDRWKEWHRGKGNYGLLKEKLEVICWRNLARRVLFVSTNGNPQPPTGPPTLSLQLLLTAARVAFEDEELDVDDVEGMMSGLMDQGYIKAYIMHSKRLLVLQKGDQLGFPKLSAVNP